MKLGLLPTTILLWASLAAGGSAQAPFQLASVVESAKSSVVRIRATECNDGQDRVGTGFLWQDQSTVVTARHVVAGCSRISAVFTDAGKSHRATPDRELRLQDLVSLTLDVPSNATPLTIKHGLPRIGSKVAALGYAYGAPTIDSKVLDVTIANTPPGSKLSDMLGDSLREKLRRAGTLDLETLVLRLDGNLLPGLSGAPIVGEDGAVLGVGSGGIQEGAGGVVWAIRADYVSELSSSPKVVSFEATEGSNLVFAMQIDQQSVPTVRCGAAEFRRSRFATLWELFQSSDDQIGLQQLAATFFDPSGDNLADTEFEIWVDTASGASIAVPAGSELRAADQTTCAANVGAGIDLLVSGTTAMSEQEILKAASDFEWEIGASYDSYLGPDLSFTYPTPRVRSDQFVVRRAAYMANVPTGRLNEVQSDYVFVTHMARGVHYVGIAATRHDFLVDLSIGQTCMFDRAHPDCVSALDEIEPWRNAALAVHLATIPPI